MLKVVSNNSINGLQCYSFIIYISPCYGLDMSNGSWGLFWVFFGHAHLKTPHIEPYEAAVLWHQNKATQSVIKLFSAILCDSVGQRILFGVSSWHLVWEATWFLHNSQLCGNPKTQFAGMQNARVPIEQWLLTQSYRPGYHWKAERIRNFFYIEQSEKKLKKNKKSR